MNDSLAARILNWGGDPSDWVGHEAEATFKCDALDSDSAYITSKRIGKPGQLPHHEFNAVKPLAMSPKNGGSIQ